MLTRASLWLEGPAVSLPSGGICLEAGCLPVQGAEATAFFPQAVLQERKDCGHKVGGRRVAAPCPGLAKPSPAADTPVCLSTCRESQWLCGGSSGPLLEPEPVCMGEGTPCQEAGHCVPG